jgi:hypothetical protein
MLSVLLDVIMQSAIVQIFQMLNDIIMSIIMLGFLSIVILLNVIMQSIIVQSMHMLNDIMLSVVILSFVLLSVILRGVILMNAKCHCSTYPHAE